MKNIFKSFLIILLLSMSIGSYAYLNFYAAPQAESHPIEQEHSNTEDYTQSKLADVGIVVKLIQVIKENLSAH